MKYKFILFSPWLLKSPVNLAISWNFQVRVSTEAPRCAFPDGGMAFGMSLWVAL